MNDDTTSLETRLLALLHQAREEHDETARAELNAWLRSDAGARGIMSRLLVDEQALVSALREESIVALMEDRPAADRARAPRRGFPWLSWRPLLAAAAGIVLGMFCTSVVWAYVAPALGKVVTLLEDGFESGPAPLVTGVPVEPGRWSGDYSEVVGEQQGVKPASGKKMLRIVRADFEGKADAEGSHLGDIHRLIDLRPFRQEFADGSAVVQLSAVFNAIEFPAEETYGARLILYAFDAETATNGSLRVFGNLRSSYESCLATASAGSVTLDRDPATWERWTSDLRLPANADFLMIHLRIPAGRGSQSPTVFSGHYLDEVRLTLRHSPAR